MVSGCLSLDRAPVLLADEEYSTTHLIWWRGSGGESLAIGYPPFPLQSSLNVDVAGSIQLLVPHYVDGGGARGSVMEIPFGFE